MTSLEYFNGSELPSSVWSDKYALRDRENILVEKNPDEMHWRLAKEFARIESTKFKKPYSVEFIYSLLKDFGTIIPQGGPMYSIGNPQYSSTSNCFVVNPPLDSYGGIMLTDEQLVQICKRRGGVGTDISHIRPDTLPTTNSSRRATGIVSFMERFSNSIREVGQCIAKGQRVLTEQGLKGIENVTTEDRVWTAIGWVKVLDVFNNGKKTVYRVITKAGYSVVTTKNHIYSSGLEEKRLSELSVGERIDIFPKSENLEREVIIEDEIISIEKVGEMDTYDLELQEEHLFWCEGIRVHNSGRRGALMLTISVHHPQVLDFARVKLDPTKVTGANVSIRLTNEFMKAVDEDTEYEQRWPVDSATPTISRKVKAREVWHEIVKCAHARAEPGLLFWDQILLESPADCYADVGFETISTNP